MSMKTSLIRRHRLAAGAAASVLIGGLVLAAQSPADAQKAVDAAFNQFKTLKRERTPTTSRRSPRSIRTCSASL
jgi:hypothetical protein